MEKNYTELLNNEEFVNKVQAAADKAELAQILNAYGIPATEEALAAAEQEMALNEEDLDNVAGGLANFLVKLNPFYWLTKWYVEASMNKNGFCG